MHERLKERVPDIQKLKSSIARDDATLQELVAKVRIAVSGLSPAPVASPPPANGAAAPPTPHPPTIGL